MKTVFILLAGYIGLLALLAVIVRPYRKRIAALGADLLCDDHLNGSERAYVEAIMKHAYSWRGAVVLLLDYVSGLFESSETMERKAKSHEAEYPRLLRDHRAYLMFECYVASVVAVNPLIGTLALIARASFRMRVRRHHTAKQAREIVDLRGLTAAI